MLLPLAVLEEPLPLVKSAYRMEGITSVRLMKERKIIYSTFQIVFYTAIIIIIFFGKEDINPQFCAFFSSILCFSFYLQLFFEDLQLYLERLKVAPWFLLIQPFSFALV